MAKAVKILIPQSGISTGQRKTSVEGEGFSGTECTAATQVFTQCFGDVAEELKPEYYESPMEPDVHNELG